jgi:hypothetical protein
VKGGGKGGRGLDYSGSGYGSLARRVFVNTKTNLRCQRSWSGYKLRPTESLGQSPTAPGVENAGFSFLAGLCIKLMTSEAVTLTCLCHNKNNYRARVDAMISQAGFGRGGKMCHILRKLMVALNYSIAVRKFESKNRTTNWD